jgi:hypothetical protein
MPANRTGRLAEHARARHEQTLQQAQAALAAMSREGAPVTIAGLAARAEVSRAWIYTQPGLRDQIEQLRRNRASSRGRQTGNRASEESLRRRLELAHQKITQLRTENHQLRQDLASVHGQLRVAASTSSWTPVHDE